MQHISKLLSREQLNAVRGLLDSSIWQNGRATAGYLSAKVKRNQQLAEDDPYALNAAKIILDALATNAVFASAALANMISPPLFNNYAVNDAYGPHIDSAIRPLGLHRMRTDMSATLFISDPDEYEGGELVISENSGDHEVKLPAGDLILYSSGAIHHVEPVRKGNRIASFFWIQSLIRAHEKRKILYDLDIIIQDLIKMNICQDQILKLTAQYHNLIRMWSDL